MTVVAALYDVHGNLPALEAVLADAAFARADAVVVGGDVAVGPMPAEVLDRLAGPRPAASAGCAATPTARWSTTSIAATPTPRSTRRRRSRRRGPMPSPPRASAPQHRDLMAGFEDVVRLDGALYCHGSPRSDDEIITAVTPAGAPGAHARRRCRRRWWCAATPITSSTCARAIAAWSTPAAWGCPTRARRRRSGCWSPTASPTARRTAYDVDAALAALRASRFPDVDDAHPREPDRAGRPGVDRALPRGPGQPPD